MAVIAQSNQYNCLIRKIGYSVGLEFLLDRAVSLANLYAEKKELNYVIWSDLVRNKFNLTGKDSVEHVANFFKSLNLIQLQQKQVMPLFGLESLSILRRFYANEDESFVQASKYLLLLYLLEADGDIFLNCLAANFDVEKIKLNLQKMIEIKRSTINKSIKNISILTQIYNIIDIKQQASNKSSGDRNNFERRKESPYKKRTENLSGTAETKVIISEDYLKKIPQTRKTWAECLDLFEGNSISPVAHKLLSDLDLLKLKNISGAFTFWPYADDLLQLYIRPEDIQIPVLSQWDIISAISQMTGIKGSEDFDSQKDYGHVIAEFKNLYMLYQQGSLVRGSIRHQLPIYISHPCMMAIYMVKQLPLPPLNKIIEYEIKSSTRRIDRSNIRGTEGGIIFRK